MEEMILILPEFSPEQISHMVPDDVQHTSAIHCHQADGEQCHKAKNDVYTLLQDAKYLYDLMPDNAVLPNLMSSQLSQCVKTLQDIRQQCEEQGCGGSEDNFGHDFVADEEVETPFSIQFDV